VRLINPLALPATGRCRAVAPAFGILLVCALIFVSLWIMANLNHNMMPAHRARQA
jgi:heme/copper-type cytochrome/quinol oxidase subunit 4